MITAGPGEIEDGIVRLREITRDDAERLYRWRMEPGTRQMFRHTAPVPYEAHLAYLEQYFSAGNVDRWFVIEDGVRPVGAIALYDFTADGTAEWGRMVVDPSVRGRGYGRRALRLLIEHARHIGLTGLRCNVGAHNTVAHDLYRSEGFVETGVELVGDRSFVQLELSLAQA